MKKTIKYFSELKSKSQPIVMLTCYDYPTAVWEEKVGVDIIFVGDSVGTNALGYQTEKEVTLDDMVHHLKAVKRGVRDAYLLTDLPFGAYDTPEKALASAKVLLTHGSDGVKLEGFLPDIISFLAGKGIEVFAHLGLNPQLHEKKGLRAKTAVDAIQLIHESIKLQETGVVIMVYELIPEEVAQEATLRLKIPTIGIGAGRYTDGQVLVVSDMLGINTPDFIHCHKFGNFCDLGINAISSYAQQVRNKTFPQPGNVRHLSDNEKALFKKCIEDWSKNIE